MFVAEYTGSTNYQSTITVVLVVGIFALSARFIPAKLLLINVFIGGQFKEFGRSTRFEKVGQEGGKLFGESQV